MTAGDGRPPPRRRLGRLAGGAAAAGLAGVGGYAASRLLGHRRLRGLPEALQPDLQMPPGLAVRTLETSDGGSIRLVEAGEGPTVVLVHGAGLSSEVWAYQFHDLADRRHLVAPDLRAHGGSEAGWGGVTVSAMADDLVAVLEGLDLRGALLAGHSMGGMAVLRFARRHRDVLGERVSALLLASTTGGLAPGISPWHRLTHLVGRAAVATDGALNPSGRHVYPGGELGYLASRVAFGAGPDFAEVEATTRLLRQMQPARFVGLLPELLGFDERAPYADLGLPVTVVVGGRDLLTPPSHSRLLVQSLPGARLVVWPGAGHMVMYERRQAFDRLLEELSPPPPPPPPPASPGELPGRSPAGKAARR